MTIHEIVRKLIGEIDPVGETNMDAKRLANLKDNIELIKLLLQDMNDLTYLAKDYRQSVKTFGNKAQEFFKEISDEYSNNNAKDN